jgi:elongation factor 1-beta
MAQFDFSTPQAIGKFNGFLSDKSYAKGYLPTSEDAKLFSEVTQHNPSGPEKKFAHVYRWYQHIKTFSEEERSSWPAEVVLAEQQTAAAAPAPAAAKAEEKKEEKKEEDVDFDDDDLFGGVSEEELAAEKQKREADKKKHKKAEEIQRSNIILDVKPWEDTTDLNKLEELVRGITMEGLTWGPSKQVEVAYGIKKLQISCVVVDDLVYTEDLEEQIQAFDEYVQSIDIAAFTKV